MRWRHWRSSWKRLESWTTPQRWEHAGICERLLSKTKICHRANRYSMIFGYCDTEVIEDDCGGVLESIHWRNMKKSWTSFFLDHAGDRTEGSSCDVGPTGASYQFSALAVENSLEWNLYTVLAILVTGEHDASILRCYYQYLCSNCTLRD